MSPEASWLRNQPRQQRSIDRVEALLDTAETVFRELGYDKANTNLIAERADIPVGTLYRWFPDKAALAEGLAARYLSRLGQTYSDLITAAPPQTDLMRTGIFELAKVVADNPALPVIIASAASSTTASVLRETLQAAIATLLQTRVPTVTDDDLARVSDMLTTVTFAVLGDATHLDQSAYDAAVDEFSALVIAWMTARFPPPDDPVWTVESPLIQPLAPSLGDRVNRDPEGIGGREL